MVLGTVDMYLRIGLSFMLELPVSFFKVDQDNLPRHKYAGKLFDFSWIPEVR